jgi:hypothetical protein
MAWTDAELESMKTVRANLVARLVEISAVVGPTYTIGNQTVDVMTTVAQLRAEISAIDADIGGQEDEGDFFEIRSHVWG